MASTERVFEVNLPLQAVYARLLNFDAYPAFLQDLRRVRQIGANRLQLEIGHGDEACTWDVEITQQIPARRIGLRRTGIPAIDVTLDLTPLGAEAGQDGTSVPLTRVRMVLSFGAAAEEGEFQAAVMERIERDLARMKKWLEQHDPAGVHVAAEVHGLHVRQNEWGGERASQEGANHAGIHDARPSLLHVPSLAELWDASQQPLRIARRVSHVLEGLLGFRRADVRDAEVTGRAFAWVPVTESRRDNGHIVVQVELPGVRTEDMDVEIRHARLVISGERRVPAAPDASHKRERRYGTFYRVVPLPAEARPQDADAVLRDGVLEITVPLTQEAGSVRRLQVRSA